MAQTNPIWWTTPIQMIAALSAAWNGGASGMPVLITWPLIGLTGLQHSGRQARYLIKRSEEIMPRVNAFGTVTNLLMAIIAFRHRRASTAAEAKWPFLLAALACNMATTAWALLVMVPINGEIRSQAEKVDKEERDVIAELAYHAAVKKWIRRSIGREVLMMGAAVCGAYATYLDGLYSQY